jgi:glycosyltransferase involved in cell wall biosynthesis
LDGVEPVRTANPGRRAPAGGGLGSLRNLVGDLRWMAIGLPRQAGADRAAVIHHPLPAFARRAAVPQVVTVVDLAFERLPQCFDRGYRTYARTALRAAARRANTVIAISQTTASDLVELWRIPRERIVVAPLGPGQSLPTVQDPRPGAEPGYFLYVGDAEPRKNLSTLLAAYAQYRQGVSEPLELVLAGSARASAPGVRSESRPSPERLAELYAGAAALVHPSLYEGFGMTPLEAMSLGIPVIAARSPGVVETCAGAARYADPRDPASFASAMAELDAKSVLRTELVEAGRRRAAQFSWAACAHAHLDAYSLALSTT